MKTILYAKLWLLLGTLFLCLDCAFLFSSWGGSQTGALGFYFLGLGIGMWHGHNARGQEGEP